MSYTIFPTDYNARLGDFDIAALQFIYGVAPTLRAGDTNYRLSASSSRRFTVRS